MPTYKGERRPLGEIEPGTPVQIMDPKAFYNGVSQFPVDKPAFGIYMGMTGYKGEEHPQIQILGAGNKLKLTKLYGARFRPSSYAGMSVDSKCDALKVLTGAKSRSLMDLMRAQAPQDYPTLSIDNGSDPEVFLVHGDGSIFPAFEFLPEKGKPRKIPALAGSYGIADQIMYWDGFQAEFTTQPSTCVSRHVDSIQNALNNMLKEARKVDAGAKLSIQSTLPISDEVMAAAEPQFVAFGCLPSFNAYGAKAQVIDDPRQLPFRFAGGHIHLGHEALHGTAVEVVKTIDAIVGVASVGMFASYDSPVRRRFYGLAGEYRLPTHGLEYRVLSNAWLSHPAITMWVYDMVREAAFLGHNGLRKFQFKGYDEARIQGIINEGDHVEARRWVLDNVDLYNRLAGRKWASKDAWGNLGAPKTAPLVSQMMIHEGIESVITDPTDIEGNWDLGKTWVSHCEGRGKNMRRLSHEIDLVGGLSTFKGKAVGV